MLWLALTPSFCPSPPASAPDSAPELATDWPACACWAGRYTPKVSLDETAPVLRFEITASLRLFGGLSALLDRVRQDIADWPWRVNLALASTPRAAFWLARAGEGAVCPTSARTVQALRRLPLAAMPLPPDVARRLQIFGLRRLGDVMDLPRASLALRVGKPFVLDLARALGEVEEPLPWFDFPDAFDHGLELPAPVAASPVLLFAARRLIRALGGWLAVRNAATREVHWSIDHGKGEETLLPLYFSSPVHADTRIERVLRQALERLNLRAPALGLRVQVRQIELRDARTQVIFAGTDGTNGTDGSDGSVATDALHDLHDRLRARLGGEALQTVQWQADHRPERASDESAQHSPAERPPSVNSVAAMPADMRRPLLLRNTPQRLSERGGRPWLDGPLRLLCGPERIESGWWDGDEVHRDYFVALDARQRCLWLYRSCRTPFAWYVHGEFA